MASSVLCNPKTRSNPPQVKSAGRSEAGSAYRALLLEKAVRSIQKNGNSVATRMRHITTQASTRLGRILLRLDTVSGEPGLRRRDSVESVVAVMDTSSELRCVWPARVTRYCT